VTASDRFPEYAVSGRASTKLTDAIGRETGGCDETTENPGIEVLTAAIEQQYSGEMTKNCGPARHVRSR
jgi:hypothetical protein